MAVPLLTDTNGLSSFQVVSHCTKPIGDCLCVPGSENHPEIFRVTVIFHRECVFCVTVIVYRECEAVHRYRWTLDSSSLCKNCVIEQLSNLIKQIPYLTPKQEIVKLDNVSFRCDARSCFTCNLPARPCSGKSRFHARVREQLWVRLFVTTKIHS